eukprot:SAG31_NODE_2382_length_5827_cov_1.421962_4_plen_319_part_00
MPPAERIERAHLRDMWSIPVILSLSLLQLPFFACWPVARAASVVAPPLSAAAAADEVTSLPGWESKSGPLSLPSKHFSGYLPVGSDDDDRHLHYYHIEAETDPDKAPLLLWLNGGPGSSSLFGMFTEVGQLVFNHDSLSGNLTRAPRLYRNPESWTTVANMLFLESPVGVGWSYCAASLTSGKPCVCNDTTTANENHDALIAFTARFPAFKDRPFFISGESYAGIYIPTLAQVIMNKGGMNLQGMAIGNGCAIQTAPYDAVACVSWSMYPNKRALTTRVSDAGEAEKICTVGLGKSRKESRLNFCLGTDSTARRSRPS